MQVQIAAAAAAAAAVPPKGQHAPMGISDLDFIDPNVFADPNNINNNNNNNNNMGDIPKTVGGKRGTKRGTNNADLTPEEKKKLNRDRNRQHARSTRLRKKAYIEKLKQLVDGLHAERSEQDRKRRVEVQHLAEMHTVRRTVIKNFLRFHSGNVTEPNKWVTLVEEDFFLKQPVTPYRSFRCGEIEMASERECRRSRGVEAMLGDAASMAIMVESVGSRSARWMQIKREEFLTLEEAKMGNIRRMPCSIQGQNGSGRLQPAVSSLSSSSRASSGNGSSSEEDRRQKQEVVVSTTRQQAGDDTDVMDGGNMGKKQVATRNSSAKQVSSSSDGSGSSASNNNNNNSRPQTSNNDYHDYHAQPLPDPKLDSGGSSAGSTNGSDSPTNGSDIAVTGKHVCTDSSSGDEERSSHTQNKKQRLNSMEPTIEMNARNSPLSVTNPTAVTPQKTTEETRNLDVNALGHSLVRDPIVGSTSTIADPTAKRQGLPPNIARSGGISHNIRPVVEGKLNSRLSSAPIVPLPPFVGIGKRAITAIGTAKLGTATTTNIVKHPGVRMISNMTHPAVSSSNGSELTQTAATPFPPHEITSSKVNGEDNNSKGGGRAPSTRNVTSLIGAYNDNCSEDSSLPQIQAYYHINEDDMLLTEDVLMCPFIFRTQDAVLCGALAECVMPGMLRAQFSEQNKLASLEMVFDAMGFMQQLERASGNEGTAQIIPNSLEMALQPSNDARVITMAQSPFRIVSVNETWTQITNYTQMEVEGKQLSLLDGPRTDYGLRKRPGKPPHDMTEVAKGRPSCTVNVYYGKSQADFISYVSSYPLTNSEDNVTHILHTFKKLPEPRAVEFAS